MVELFTYKQSVYIYVCAGLCVYICACIGLMSRVFANGLEDRGSILGRVIPKIQIIVLDVTLLNTQHYKVRINRKLEQSKEEKRSLVTPWCSSYSKGIFRVPLD